VPEKPFAKDILRIKAPKTTRMENNTLNFNYMKAKVKSDPTEWATYTFVAVYALAIVILAVSTH
jgi:hypothetical protein